MTLWYSENVLAINNVVTNAIGTAGILVGGSSTIEVIYCNSYGNSGPDYTGVTPGLGSISLDPLYVGGAPFDYHLQAGSPCIDAGDPSSPYDPDGTIADMGAYYYGGVTTELGFDIADVYVTTGAGITVPVYVSGLEYTNVAGFEFHIEFDGTCLQFDNITSTYVEDMEFNLADGILHVLWEDIQAPVSPVNNSSFVDLHFTVLGGLNTTCEINWTGLNEVVDVSGSIVEGLGFTSGSVIIAEMFSISGNVIYYDFDQYVENVLLELGGNSNAMTYSNDDGEYIFENVLSGDYTVCPSFDENDNGVNVSDIILIRQHILMSGEFDSPYKLIAADVNNSNTISVADILKIRMFIADIEPLPSGNWAFVDSSFVITNENWSDAPNCVNLSLVDTDLSDVNFVGIRMGDVNSSWPHGSIVNNDTVSIDLNDGEGYVGERVVIDMTVDGFVNVAGVELHISYPSDQITFVDISSEIMTNPTINISDDQIHFIWEDINNLLSFPDGQIAVSIDIEIGDGAPALFEIPFEASFVVDGDGEDFTVLSYNGSVNRLITSIDDDEAIPSSFDLGLNYPNPFNASTTINYQLPKSTHVQIVIYDVLGRIIDTVLDETKEAGYHQVVWNSENQPTGIYLYRMVTDEFTKTSKMLYLK